MNILMKLALCIALLAGVLAAPLGLSKLNSYEAAQREKLCLHGTECWNELGFAEKLRRQKIWRSGGSLE